MKASSSNKKVKFTKKDKISSSNQPSVATYLNSNNHDRRIYHQGFPIKTSSKYDSMMQSAGIISDGYRDKLNYSNS